jgi:hypothetical protein
MPTRRIPALLRVGSAFALVLVLAACTKGGQFDPTELLNSDMFDSKKKIAGDRQPMFPEGVPGTTTGVPADLVKGYQAPADEAAATPAPAPVAEAAKPKPKPKPKPKLAAAPAPQQQQPQQQGQDSVWNQKPAPPPKRISIGSGAQQAAPAPEQAAPSPAWPAATQAAPVPQAGQPAQSIWPNPPASGKSSQ